MDHGLRFESARVFFLWSESMSMAMVELPPSDEEGMAAGDLYQTNFEQASLVALMPSVQAAPVELPGDVTLNDVYESMDRSRRRLESVFWV